MCSGEKRMLLFGIDLVEGAIVQSTLSTLRDRFLDRIHIQQTSLPDKLMQFLGYQTE
jgi:hypothetical protein